MNYKNKIIHGDCIKIMASMEPESVDLVCCDPPFNINLDYDVYRDKLPYEEYYKWSEDWIEQAHRILRPNGSIWVFMGDEFAAEVNIILKKQGFYFRNWIIWHYTFGQNLRVKFSRCHTHILYFTKSKDEFTFNRDAIKVPSARQLKYNDKRAKAGGKTPDDVWEVHTDEPPQGGLGLLHEDELIWGDSRVCGTFKERILNKDGSAHPCQLPSALVRRIIKASSNEGDLVFDAFSGTGTTAHAAKEEGRHFTVCDLSEEYCRVTAARLFADEDRFVVHDPDQTVD